MLVHIEGMGLIGCLLAWRLERAGVQFTWDDLDCNGGAVRHTAWKACTGAIYPGGQKGSVDRTCYDLWQQWFGSELLPEMEPWFEPAGYWFNHLKPPHDGSYKILRDEGALRLGEEPTLHCNAQQMVPALRARWAANHKPHNGPVGADVFLKAHGFGPRMSHAYWGWTRKVELEIDPRLGLEGPVRGAFYLRKGRFVMAYAYPVPGENTWYAGSSIISQRAAALKSLEMPSKYERWKRFFEELSGGLVRVGKEHEFLEGWRPAQKEKDRWVVLQDKNVLSVPPLWSSGLRHFPKVWTEIERALSLNKEQSNA